MKKPMVTLCAWLCAGAFAVAGKPAEATGTNQISYVSGTGTDSPNTCTNPTTDACATFAYALAQTASGGEIDCVNSGDYGDGSGFSIAQSVTIDCAAGVGFSIRQIDINGAGIIVRLRNLTFNREGFGQWAIGASNMAALYVENCVVINGNATLESVPPNVGISFQPSANAQLFVSNTVVSNNGLSAGSGVNGGIYVAPAPGVTATITIDHSRIYGNVSGIIADGSSGGIAKVTVSNSVVSGNAANGILATSSGSSVWLLVDRAEVSGNGAGIAVGGSGAKIVVRNTSVFANTTGLTTESGGTILSYGTNSVIGNGTNGAFTSEVGME